MSQHDKPAAGDRAKDQAQPENKQDTAPAKRDERAKQAAAARPEEKAEREAEKNEARLSSQQKTERKQRVLTRGTPSITHSIADAVVIKDENLYFLTKPDGDVPLGADHGFGLYYHDCRYLNGYQFTLAGAHPNVLVSNAAAGFMAVLELTNPETSTGPGRNIRKDDIGVKWQRVLDGGNLALYDLITFQNYGMERIEFPVSLSFQADFNDVFAIRGLLPERPGQVRAPAWKDGALSFVYDGADGLFRSLSVQFSQLPAKTEGTTVHYNLSLDPRGTVQLLVSLIVAESPEESQVQPQTRDHPHLAGVASVLQRTSDEWRGNQTEIHSESLLLDAIMERSLRDLRVLRSSIDHQKYFAAGVPWFTTLFGRDSVVTALQTLAYDPEIAAQTLRVLAHYQGHKVDNWRDEQPGKILHELRMGELARLDEIPHTPYYGSIDATPLFLILVARHAAWTGDLTLFHELRDNVELALEWMSKYGDLNGDGYIEYQSTSERGLINQGWKDSGDAVVNADGSLGRPPIAMAEVQGYAYMARIQLAHLYERDGDQTRAAKLRQEAQTLRDKFNRDFWLEDKGIYAMALQKDGQPVAVVSSNAGQVLWTGIADQDKAQQTANRLMAEDMLSGWGIRTLSTQEKRYNPIGYHLGTVWPHDNSIIAAGLRRYGLDAQASRVFTGIVVAAMGFGDYRLPELFAGFSRQEYSTPVHYPVACHPQAWAAGTVPYLVETMLGLVPEAFDHRLRVVRPLLPDFVDTVDLRRLRVGNARVDLHLERTENKAADGMNLASVHVLKVDGKLDVVVGAVE